VPKQHDFHGKRTILIGRTISREKVLALCVFIRYDAFIMPKAHDDKKFDSVAAFMRASGLNDAELAKLLDIDRSEATRLRLGRTYRSLVKPLKIAKVCKVPIESLAPSKAA
jgi:hypothetical protein